MVGSGGRRADRIDTETIFTCVLSASICVVNIEGDV